MNERTRTVNSRIWMLALCLLLSAWPALAQAQTAPVSLLVFPRFVSYPD